MKLDFSEHFKRYEQFLKQIDGMFERMQQEYPEAVCCGQGCTDCCYAMFDLHLIEALYLNDKFNKLDSDNKDRLLIEADKADRKVFKMKRKMAKAHKAGQEDEQILQEVAKERLRCPLLSEDDKCAMYENRPITCRLYGLPLEIDGQTHTCGKSGFIPGKQYPTVKMGIIHEKLMDMSRELAIDINSKYKDLYALLLPLSSSLLIEFNADYLGARQKGEAQKDNLSQKQSGLDEWVAGDGE